MENNELKTLAEVKKEALKGWKARFWYAWYGFEFWVRGKLGR